MNIRKLTAVVFVSALAVGCTQGIDDTNGSSTSAVEPSSSGGGDAKRPMLLLADVIDLAGKHALVPFALPPRDADAATKTPPACIVHRPSAADAMDGPPPPPEGAPADAPPPSDGMRGPAVLQIAVFESAADATAVPTKGTALKRPLVVVECFGAPGATRVDVPRDVLDGAFAGLSTGATARIALAGFPMPPPPGGDVKTPPPLGRGVFGIAAVSDTSKIDALFKDLTLP